MPTLDKGLSKKLVKTQSRNYKMFIYLYIMGGASLLALIVSNKNSYKPNKIVKSSYSIRK